ncbi:hypothetical protein [Halobacterium noricense]|jgi:hypothetical protein|uniref:hypothetical protein n=1 Tax=Halobacterium noricense TaxID=223182 RepID=UPI001E35D43E|nr:hypothetical protein [Halobacterium noricense]UHH27177.1 hypothetical protein LT974_16125 [Halobacterium noricense]
MATETLAFVYWSAMVVLFFFWTYGIVSFGLDLKNKIIPGIRQYWRGRQRIKEEEEEEKEQDEREEREKQLY